MHFKGASFLALIVSCVVAPTNSENATQIGKKRIIGGQECKREDYNGMAAIKDLLQRHRCGGTILNDRWILTAAHCIDGGAILVVISGPNEQPGANIYLPQGLFPHPQYDSRDFSHNIGLIYLSTRIPRSKLVPVKYPKRPLSRLIMKFCGTVRAKGWGTTDNSETMSKTLQCVDLPVIPHDKCLRHYYYYAGKTFQDDNIICTLSRKRQDACKGDSGGPLICRGVQIGITSWGIDCANPNFPGIFTRVDRYLKFITHTLKNKRSITLEEYLSHHIGSGHMLSKLSIMNCILLVIISKFL